MAYPNVHSPIYNVSAPILERRLAILVAACTAKPVYWFGGVHRWLVNVSKCGLPDGLKLVILLLLRIPAKPITDSI